MNPYEHRRLSFLLAVIMHGLIGAFVALGVQWHTQQAAPLEVELWEGQLKGGPVAPRPDTQVAPVKIEIPQPLPPVELPEPVVDAVPDIVIAKPRAPSKKIEAPKVKHIEKPPVPKVADRKTKFAEDLAAIAEKYGSKAGSGTHASAASGRLIATPVDTTGALAGLAARQQAAEARARSGAEDAYKIAVRNKIKRNMNFPDDVTGNPEVVYKVTLLPDMSVLDVVLTKASGNPAFDEAVKRAIKGMGEFPPLPPGFSFSDWRQYTLKYRLRD